MYKNKDFRAILSWVCVVMSFFWRGGPKDDLGGVLRKLYLLPPLLAYLPQPMPSFWCKAAREIVDQIMWRLFGFVFAAYQTSQQACRLHLPSGQRPAPSTLHQVGQEH